MGSAMFSTGTRIILLFASCPVSTLRSAYNESKVLTWVLWESYNTAMARGGPCQEANHKRHAVDKAALRPRQRYRRFCLNV